MESPVLNQTNIHPGFLTGGGEMGLRIREFDWSQTSIGSMETWPQNLRSALNICLHSTFPAAVYWGKELLLFYNDPWSLNAGTKHLQPLGHPAKQVLSDISEAIEPQLKKALAGEPGSCKDLLFFKQSDDSAADRYFDFMFTPLYNDEGKTEGVFNALMETTGRLQHKGLSQKEKESQQNLAELANAMPQLVWIAEPNGDVNYYNNRVNEFSGATQTTDGSWHWEGLVHPDDLKTTSDAWAAAVKSGGVYEAEHRIQMKDGLFRWFLSRGLPHRNKEGVIIKWFGTATDIHEQKEAEEKLQYLATLTQNVADAVIGTDINYRITSWNRGAEIIYGWSREKVIGKTSREVLQTKFSSPELEAQSKKQLEGTGYWQGEVEQRRKDGSLLSVLASVAYLKDKDEKLSGAVAVNRDITVQKKAALELQTIKNQLELTFRNVPSAIYLLERSGNILFVNENAAQMMGFTSAEEVLAQKDHTILKETMMAAFELRNDKGELISSHQTPASITFRTGRPSEAIIQSINKKTGAVIWSLSKSEPLLNEAGELEMVLASSTDITLQKTAERAVRQSEEKFRTLAESLPQLVWMTDEKGAYEFASSQWIDYSGLDPHEESTWSKLVHPEDIGGLTKTWSASLQTGKTYRAEARLKSKSGIYRWHIVEGEPLRNEEGAIVKWIGAFTDIHGQKEIEEKLEQTVEQRTLELAKKNIDLANAQTFLQQVIDSSVEFISVIDRDFNYITVNRQFENGLQSTRDQLHGKNIFDVNPKAKDTVQHESILKALRGETVYLDKRPAVAKPEFYVDTYFLPLIIQGVIEGVIIMSRDVTDIARSEKLLEQKNEELLRSNEDLQQFAHVASHDLKEPVRKVRTFGSRLEEEFGSLLPEKGKLYLDKMHAAADRMFGLIDGVLNYSTINSLEGSVEAVDLNKIINEIETDLEVALQQKSAVLKTEKLPLVKGSGVLLNQLFYNLINNALKFSKPEERPVINIRSKLVRGRETKQLQIEGQDAEKEFVQVRICDNGIGFEQEHAEKIFKTFTRLNSRDKFEGTGLGLALCKKIAERHNGYIYATAKEGEGACFYVLLPA